MKRRWIILGAPAVLAFALAVRSHFRTDVLVLTIQPDRSAILSSANGRINLGWADLLNPSDRSRLRFTTSTNDLGFAIDAWLHNSQRFSRGVGNWRLSYRTAPADVFAVGVRMPHWFMTVLAASPLLATAVFRARRRALRRAAGLCPTCGYDLRHSPGRCPECGTLTTQA